MFYDINLSEAVTQKSSYLGSSYLFLQEEKRESCGRVDISFWVILEAGHILLRDPVDE